MGNPKLPLHAIATERNVHGTWIPEIVHVHAADSAQAKFFFLRDPANRNSRIVAIGPVVGYHVEDEHGEKLRA